MPVVNDYTALLSGDSWNGLELSATPAVITYSFATGAPSADSLYMGSALGTFQALTTGQKTQVRNALDAWATVSGLQFVEVPAGASDIVFSSYDFSGSPSDGAGGVGVYPFGDWNVYSYPNFLDGWDGAGHVMLNRDYLTGGLYNFGLLLHEIGHALGLKHPTEDFHNYASGIDHNQVLASDTGADTVMTQQLNGPQSLTALDIAAIQHVYGTNAQDAQQGTWTYTSVTDSFVFIQAAAGGVMRGSAVADTMNGSGHNDTLIGLYGNDLLNGAGGSDILFGGSGADRLSGGLGADTMYGGKGDDNYVVDNASDVVIEFAGEGNDTVSASVTYALAAEVEILRLTGTGDFSGTGNSMANTISGNGADNHLYGLEGNDLLRGLSGNDWLDAGADGGKMLGGAGNDTYIVRVKADVVREDTVTGIDDGGHDTVTANLNYILPAFVEDLVLSGAATKGTGNALGNAITGTDAVDALLGMDGNDTLTGGKGDDRLTGGNGADRFRFNPAATNGRDHIFDFTPGTDQLAFTGSDYGFAMNHVLTAAELTIGSAASGAAAQFVYNPATHVLFWDQNGSGAGGATSLAVLDNVTTLAASDFLFL